MRNNSKRQIRQIADKILKDFTYTTGQMDDTQIFLQTEDFIQQYIE